MTPQERIIIQRAHAELSAAKVQRAPSDDRIIAEHIVVAEAILQTLLRATEAVTEVRDE